MGGGEEGKKSKDERVEWLLERIATLLSVGSTKMDKFKSAFYADQNSLAGMHRFLDEVEITFCFFYPTADSVLANADSLPTAAQVKKKIVAVHRRRPEVELSKANIADNVVVFEITKNVMDILNVYCHSVYLSTLTNPANQRGWSDLIAKDLMDKYHVFLANLHVTVGLMKGHTWLPQPPRDALPTSGGGLAGPAAASSSAAVVGSKDRVHVLEGNVITWTKQIRHVLKQDPEMLLREGKNPEPSAELQFWKSKAANLNSIHSQLGMDGLKKVLKFLETNKSTYTTPFSRLQKEVEEAREEANDNVKFLSTLTKGIDKLMSETADFEVLDKMFDGILHTILLIWKHSKYYNTPTRLAVLIREICNTVINQAVKYISGPDVFNMISSEEANECYDKLDRTLRVCTALKDTYVLYRDIATAQGGDGWKMKNDALFVRLDAFRERCRDALDFTRTVMQFTKLERIEIGGTKGKTLSDSVVAIHEEFMRVVEEFKAVPYDIMNVGERQFDHDFYKFRVAVKDLDRRLGSLLAMAFDDLDTIQQRLKLFDNFEGLLERPIIQAELEKKHRSLLQQYQADLSEVEAAFVENREKVDQGFDDAPIFSNMPPIAGSIYWSRSSKNRVDEPMVKLVFYNHTLRETPEEFREVDKQYANLVKMLEEYEHVRYSDWESSSVEVAKDKLKMRLLRRQEKTGLLKVNFDPALVRLLREIRFFLIFDIKVPDGALEVFNRSATYRHWTAQLDHIVHMYNSVLTELLPVEEPLLEERIVKMDVALSPGLTDLKWRSEDKIPDFIESTMKVVSDVSGVVAIMKGNLRSISQILSTWCKEPIIERKRGAKPMAMDEFELKHKERVGMRMMAMTEGGKEIHKFLKDSSEALKVSKVAPIWKSYVDFVNNIVIEGFVSSIAVSLQYLCEILDPLIIAKHEMLPLFDVKIELVGQEIVFDPPFKNSNPRLPSLRKTVDDWLKDFFGTVTCMFRLDVQSGDYLNEIREHFQMQCLLALVSELIDNTELKCMEYRETFMQHSFLWMDDMEAAFELFLQHDAHDLVEGFEEEGMDFRDIMKRIKVDMGRPIPRLHDFDKEIERFAKMMTDLSGMKTPVTIHWLRINAEPVKLELVKYANKWHEKYSQYLKQYTEERIFEVHNYLEKLKDGLGSKSPIDFPEDERLLYSVMTHIRDVKLSTTAIRKLFHPIRDLCHLLKKHHVHHEGSLELEQAPSKWEEVIRLSYDEKEKILDLQTEESIKIRNKVDAFGEKVSAFRKTFQRECPFDSTNAESGEFQKSYDTINEYYAKVAEIREQARENNDLELLFDMTVSNYRDLEESNDELGSLKDLWDGVVEVVSMFQGWNDILWEKIDTEELLLKVREIQKKVKDMPKAVKTWKLYRWLQDEVKNMATVLPLVNDLHSETMRDRHWTALMAATKTTFDKGPDFCFKNLLDLKLHHVSEDVGDIVDQSVKEAKIEKKLGVIRKTWSKMQIQYDWSLPDCPLLGELGEVRERLDADSLEMMGMTSQGRFIEFCKPVVDEWSGKLRAIDSTMEIWQKVQTNWLRLEPIFLQSDDIRSQLPEDAKRFEQLDNKWKDLMMEAKESSFIVEMCCAEGREAALQEVSENIDACEKALNEYLEQKKKIFPRFYFCSNQALLDILSNGNRPLKVAEYLGDIFDGVKTLDFSKAPDTGRIGAGIISKDGEKVPFNDDVKIEGAVENYLANLEAHFRIQLQVIADNAGTTAENWEVEKPREFWLEDYCAQLALVATQVVWTADTVRAFEEIEGGSEVAMKDYKKVCDDRIEKLIKRVQTPLSREVRNKIITIITIDVHSRDIVEAFVVNKITDPTDFKWLSQLQFRWNFVPQDGKKYVSYTQEDKKTIVIKICDWVTIYCYEYVGNCGRLVITPLTDRCYITLTQALNLILGGAPAGPAGTGKTETTKDLSRAIGLQIVVFNCSDQMTYQSMGDIFMGIAQTGCWGCFDEFNRISIEVLSVVSTQYKTILDAIRQDSAMFTFMDEEIRLISTCGAFITMNPGYAGRTELPENLKALFRSMAMIVPDLAFICENMLMSEGFIKARPLANKFVQLYALCKELLSKQMHYDWGLRAVKSLLRQAGGLKRTEPEADEFVVLCRALRDFNTPKITTLDMPIFLRLIQDLFPGINPSVFEDPEFEKVVAQVTKSRGLQPDTQFIIKVVSMLGILEVRHCMFIIGPTGCGKTEVWKTLIEAQRSIGKDGLWEQANPKGVTSDELYGTMSKTKEWKDGLIAVIMRNMSKEMGMYKPTHVNKWVILDGDIDATWIESMNTVMDDNKVLTLVSNERIPFTPSMRMILEIQDMKHASPATVSRGGVLFINETDIGWRPFMESWREKMDQVPQNAFYLHFASYFESNIEAVRKNFGFSCPIFDMGFVQSLTCFIDAILMERVTMESMRSMNVEDQKMCYDAMFAFAMMWTIGGAVADDKTTNYRKAFNSFMRSLCKTVRFPDAGECYDYFFDPKTKEWANWEDKVTAYTHNPEKMYQNIVVCNVELERMKNILNLHVQCKKPVLYVGVAGTMKTTIVKDYLADLKARTEEYVSMSINNNNYTTSAALQAIIMTGLDKRSGRTFGPPANKKCIFFIDDLNMPYVDTYDTQSAIMLLTQMLAYAQVYDRAHLEEKRDLVDILFTACMNPKAGSFMVNPRLQRRFTVQTTFTPTAQVISGIFAVILEKHLAGFSAQIYKMVDPIVNATIETLTGSGGILNTPCFLPSASKFHYQFNLRDVANIFQGLLNTQAGVYKGGATQFCRAWLHEAYRVFSDRLINTSDQHELQGILEKVSGKHFSNVPKDDLFAQPIIFTSFVSQHLSSERAWIAVKDMAQLKKVVEDKLVEHNETYAAMNLVLFDDALSHVCRISRITDNPCGHALLVGVGGSGKQSLARLASFINSQDVLRILVNQSYGMADLRENLQEFYKKAAMKPALPQAFLMTDGQIADERFLVFINDMLSSGNIPDLFAREEYDAIFGTVRNAAKAKGYSDDRDGLFTYFIDTVRRNLHFILCHSPGDVFRVRGRKFPALISCMTVDEYMPWPRQALDGVARRFLASLVEKGNIHGEEMLANIAATTAEVHLSIDAANKKFLAEERRYNYTTPKSFLELLNFYIIQLTHQQDEVLQKSERLDKGLMIMEQVQSKVEGLKDDLKTKMIQVEEKKAATNVLIDQVSKASVHAAGEQEKALEEEKKTTALASAAKELKDEADGELAEAKPAMEAAKEAVNCLDKNSIGELKMFQTPPKECIPVCAACAFLLQNVKKAIDWKAAQKMMNNPAGFIDEVSKYDAREIPEQTLKNVDELIALPFFNFDVMKGKSVAAANLCNWIVNCVKFHKIYIKVAPLMAKVEKATNDKEEAEASLEIVRAQVAEIQAEVGRLDEKLKGAIDEKEAVEAEAARCVEKLGLAERLVNGLADEYKRWTETVKELKELGIKLIGNCLLSSAFVGYISPFSMKLRVELWKDAWTKDILARGIPMTDKIDPMKILATEADLAGWQNEGLPSDRISCENAAVVTSCSRWPLMIDPQLQGVKWIKQRVGEELTVLQFTMNNWLQKVIMCIQMGGTLLIEAVGKDIDAILEPVLSRAIIRKGKTAIVKIGGEEVDYDPKFQLYLQSKLPNPHYQPEIAAQCTIINFIVTPDGLEDQVLAMVVNEEKPELEQQKQALVRRQNDFKVELAQLEDDLLSQLSQADPATILENIPLIEGLEKTKLTANEIAEQVQEAQKTEVEINRSRELYRPVAAEGSMIFFLIIQLCFIEHMYQYSLDSFVTFLMKAIDKTEPTDDITERTKRLIMNIRMTVFRWVNRGLFEEHKLLFCSMITFKLFQLHRLPEEFNKVHFDFLVRAPGLITIENPLGDWLPNKNWGLCLKLSELEGFESFATNMEKDAPTRFKEWFNELTPEDVRLPGDWKRLDSAPFQKLLALRCLRPDRLTGALAEWIRNILPNGRDYMDCDGSSSFQQILMSSFEDSTSTTPIFFILSPGADPVKEVEAMGRKMINLQLGVNYHNVAMGQGQDVVAMAKLDTGHREGHWVMLQNIHLMPRWCVELEKRLDAFIVENSHPGFRVILSADPSKGIPIGILERSIKLTNEPPQGMLANLRRSFALFNKEDFEEKDSKVKAILFALVHFHSLMLERKKFGPMGYNMKYSFSAGDLRDSSQVLYNYLEGSSAVKIPWDDLRYIFGEIMYGGYIVDDWDRRMCKMYLLYFMRDELLDEIDFIPYADGKLSWPSPQPGPHDKYLEHIESMPTESPLFFGMHPNAEINFRTAQCDRTFAMIMTLSGGGGGGGGGEEDAGSSPMARAEAMCAEILEEVAEKKFATDDINRSMTDEEKGPYQYVFMQECDYMAGLIFEMVRGLQELTLGFKGELQMSEQMEDIADALWLEKLPYWWVKLGFPSTRPLKSWRVNLQERCVQLDDWINDPLNIPKVVDMSKLFNPQSFLTAVMQLCCQTQGLELDKLQVYTEVTKRDVKQVDAHSKEGAYVTGMYLEGARWDPTANSLEDSKPKEMFVRMPVVNCKAGLSSDRADKNVYICPTYCVPTRRPWYVFAAQLRTKAIPDKWVLAGVAMILDIGTV